MVDRARNLFARCTSGATLFLIFAGGLVTSTGSGLAVPDWPLSFGMLFPPMVGGVFYEHGHRMIAGTVGILTAILAAWFWLREPRVWVRRLALIALAAVVVQAILGGITVLFLLPAPVSVAHACLGQTFFCLTVVLAMATGRTWQALGARGHDTKLAALAAVTTGAVSLQLVLGAVMRHTGAGLAIPDFPLAFGRLVPAFASAAIGIHFAHRLGAVAVTALVLWTAMRIFRRHGEERLLARPATLLLVLVASQLALGALTIWTSKAVLPTTLHVAAGAAILATSLVLAIRTRILFPHSRPRAAARSSNALPEGVTA